MTEWGPEIEVNGVRPEWLDSNFLYRPASGVTRCYGPVCGYSGWAHVGAIRLPADHWAYTAINAGFVPWAGGESAPDDWDGDKEGVLYRDGKTIGRFPYNWRNSNDGPDIIGYRKRADTAEDDGDYVRVKRMTAREYQTNDTGSLGWARRAGIIREETLLEQFERDHPKPMSERTRRHVREALEWMEARNA